MEPKSNWHGIMKVFEIQHLSKENEVLWEEKQLFNILHTEGEQFILTALFVDNTVIPTAYYLGLDNRPTLGVSDTMSSVITTEPVGNGYVRQPVLAQGEFVLGTATNGFSQVQTPILTFQASGGSWGPIINLFMTDQSDSSGSLISSIRLSTEISLNDGEKVTVRMGFGMRDCTL